MAKKNVISSEISALHKNLKLLHIHLRNTMKKEWDRVLPFDELLFDRWEKAHFLNAQKKASIYHNSYVYGKVVIGKNTWVGPFTVLDGSGGLLKIGDFCSISSGVQIYTHHTVKWSLTGGKAEYEKGPVNIGNYCYLGPNVVVTKNVKIGKCCVIGAHSLVNSNVPAHSIVYGVPGKVVGKLKIDKKNVKLQYFHR